MGMDLSAFVLETRPFAFLISFLITSSTCNDEIDFPEDTSWIFLHWACPVKFDRVIFISDTMNNFGMDFFRLFYLT